MTAIIVCLKTGVIACDSRIIAGDMIMCDSEIKRSKVDGELHFTTGDTDDTDIMLDIILNSGICKRDSLIANVVYTKKGKVFYSLFENGELETHKITHSRGFGNGGELALSALDFGCSARDAIKYAITRNIYCGGKIHSYKIPNWSDK